MTVEAQSDELVLLWSLTCLYYLSVSQARCILCTSRSWCGDTWYRMGVVEGKICFKIYILKGWIHQVCFSFNIQSETPGPVWLLQIWDSYWYFGWNKTSALLMSSFIPKFWNSCLPNKPLDIVVHGKLETSRWNIYKGTNLLFCLHAVLS